MVERGENDHTIAVGVFKTRLGSPDYFFHPFNLPKVREYFLDIFIVIIAGYVTRYEHKLRFVLRKHSDFA